MSCLLGVIVGIPFMLRMLRERDAMRQEWPPAPAIDGQWRQLPGDATPLSARRSVLSRLSRQPSVTSRPAV